MAAAFKRRKAAASRATNPVMRMRDDDNTEDNITVSQLEQTITEERSPVRSVDVRKKSRTRPRQAVAPLTLSSPVPIKVEVEQPCIQVAPLRLSSSSPVPIKVDVEEPCIQVVESQADENLSSQISEVDTQQQDYPCTSRSYSGPVPSSRIPEDEEGLKALIESATTSSSGRTEDDGTRLRRDQEYNFNFGVNSNDGDFTTQSSVKRGQSVGGSGEVGKSVKSPQGSEVGKSLLESFKAIKTKYDSKVRLFGHDLRNGKYQKVVSKDLVIRQVVERHEKTVKAIVYDVAEDKCKWVIFKSADQYEIVEGACVTLYMPWQQIMIEGGADPVIVGANFFKVFQSSCFNLTKQNISEILKLPLPASSDSRVSEPLFMDLVPYHVRNSRTVEKQVSRSKCYIDIEIVVLNVWEYSYSPTSPVLCLIKDSDDFVTFLEIPKIFKDLTSKLSPGKYFQMTSVAVHKKIRISEKLAPFSVIRQFDARQTYFFSLKWENESQWEPIVHLDIPMSYPRDDFQSMDEIDMASKFLDCRFSRKCKLKEKGRRHLLVHDLDSDRSLMIDVVLGSDYSITDIPVCMDEKVLLKFVRIIHGKAIWDRFTTCEKLSEED